MSHTVRHIPHWVNWAKNNDFFHKNGPERDRYLNGRDKHSQTVYEAFGDSPKGYDKWNCVRSRKGKATERRLTSKVLRNRVKKEIRKVIDERVFD